MPANVYECMFLLDTNKVQGDVTAAAEQLHAILEKNNAELLASRPWDERRLAYPIKKAHVSHKKGLYYLTYFRSEGKNLVPIENECKLNEMIIRMMFIKIDPKLVEPMLAMARDEHAVAFQSVHEEPSEGRGDEGGEDRPRRFRDREREPAETE